AKRRLRHEHLLLHPWLVVHRDTWILPETADYSARDSRDLREDGSTEPALSRHKSCPLMQRICHIVEKARCASSVMVHRTRTRPRTGCSHCCRQSSSRI